MQNILVTGATSYIGKHLIKKLLKSGQYNVTAIAREGSNLDIIGHKQEYKIHYYEASYQSIESLFQTTSFDCVIHLAAHSGYNHDSSEISLMIDSNIKLGTFILEAMRQYHCPYFINTSTYWQHYKDHNYQPICLYAATKKAFEDIIEYYCMDGSIKAISLKLYDVYGYEDHRDKLLNILIKQKNDDHIFNLTKGEQKLCMVFIDDVIDAYLEALKLVQEDSVAHSVYEVFGEEKFSLKEIVKILEERLNKKFKINWGQKSYYKFQIMDPQTKNKLKNWQAKVSLKEGIEMIKKVYDK